MTKISRHLAHRLFGASALALSLAAGPALADSIFTPSADVFTGTVSAGAAERGNPVYPGTEVVISGEALTPGQQVTLMRGTTVLNADGPLTVDAEGKLSFNLTVDEEAATGVHPIVLIAENPAAATVVDLKVSPQIPLSGEAGFTVESAPVTRGLYQVAYSPAAEALFITAAVGRPPVTESALVKVNPETLETLASVTPGAAPARPDGSDGGVFAVYGIDVDDANGNVWVTNTRQNTVAVYKQDDLSLVHQFEPGAVAHARDVVVDEANGRVYTSATGTPVIEVFDSASLEKLEPITIPSQQRRAEFSVMSLALDEAGGKLVTVSMSTPEAAVVDLASGEVKVLPVPGLLAGSGVAYDPQEGLVFLTGQGSDNLIILSAETGEVLHDVEVGAGALNVAFDPVSRLAFVSNRGSDTLAVVNTDGEIVANLDGGSYPNQARATADGTVYAVNKSRGEDDAEGDRVWRIRPAAQ